MYYKIERLNVRLGTLWRLRAGAGYSAADALSLQICSSQRSPRL